MQWIKLTDRMPNPDEHGRVLIYTEGYDFNGEQVFEVKAALNEYFYANPEDQPEVCRHASHWAAHPCNAALHPTRSLPPDYCYEIDHGTAEDRAVFCSHSAKP
jgi:hypothetical protein